MLSTIHCRRSWYPGTTQQIDSSARIYPPLPVNPHGDCARHKGQQEAHLRCKIVLMLAFDKPIPEKSYLHVTFCFLQLLQHETKKANTVQHHSRTELLKTQWHPFVTINSSINETTQSNRVPDIESGRLRFISLNSARIFKNHVRIRTSPSPNWSHFGFKVQGCQKCVTYKPMANHGKPQLLTFSVWLSFTEVQSV